MPQSSSTIVRFLTLAAFSCAALSLIAADKPHRVEVIITGLQFKPATVKIHVGDTVVWINNDDRDHTVIARDGAFKSPNIRAGQTFEVRFIRAGSYAYGCNYHPRMKGVVVVE